MTNAAPKTVPHRIRTKHRPGSLRITERADCVIMRLKFSRYGHLGDEDRIHDRLRPLLARYEDDPRPVTIHDDRTGWIYTVSGDGSDATIKRCDG
jgi:hypothetical protein